MIAFLDTSVVIKLYLDENGSQAVRELVDSDADIAVSSIAYTETHSGIARRIREGIVSRRDGQGILQNFEIDWLYFGKIQTDEKICRKAGKLCLKHPIRSLDAIQLAAALTVSDNVEEPFVFLTADKRLEAAARKEKLQVSISD